MPLLPWWPTPGRCQNLLPQHQRCLPPQPPAQSVHRHDPLEALIASRKAMALHFAKPFSISSAWAKNVTTNDPISCMKFLHLPLVSLNPCNTLSYTAKLVSSRPWNSFPPSFSRSPVNTSKVAMEGRVVGSGNGPIPPASAAWRMPSNTGRASTRWSSDGISGSSIAETRVLGGPFCISINVATHLVSRHLWSGFFVWLCIEGLMRFLLLPDLVPWSIALGVTVGIALATARSAASWVLAGVFTAWTWAGTWATWARVQTQHQTPPWNWCHPYRTRHQPRH